MSTTSEAVDPGASDAESPISDAALTRARDDLQKIWKRIVARAPEDVRARVDGALTQAEAIIGHAEARLADRLALARALEELGAEVRGRRVFEPTFYTGGKLGLITAWDPIIIQGAIDNLRVEQFFERYMRRAELAFERLEYFMTRAGLLQPKERAKKPAWEQPYAQFEQYHELIWGRTKKATTTPPKPKPQG